MCTPSRRFPLILGLFLALALAGACGRAPVEPIRLATNVWPGYEPLYLARQLGTLDPKGFHLVEMSNASDAVRALKAGRVAGAALTLDETLTLLQDDVDLQVVLVMDVSSGADAILGRPQVASLAALKGRRVGVEQSAVGGYLLTRALDRVQLRPADVVIVPITQGAHEASFLKGSLDALVTFEPTRSRLLARGAKVLFDSSQIPGEIFDVLVLRGDVARARPEVAAQLRQGWFQALAYLRDHPQDAAHRMAPREQLGPESFHRALQGLTFPDAEAEARMRGGGLLAPARRLADLMFQEKLLQRPVDPARLLAPRAP